ncbi:metallophosphoesterase family protein [Pseudomonas aeruginosa]|nr:metallophosphoesterase family protein [Pseudomonas aeruginosa]
MKIRLLSDLHHEHFDGRRQLPEVEADVVVLAGDIHSHLEGLHWARETFADSEIVYVAGNHEFYSSEMTDLTQAMRNIARALEIHFLENDEARIGPARFLGATLWTDFRSMARTAMHPPMSWPQSMPDFSCIELVRWRLHPEQSIALHQASRDWLAEQLARPHDGPTLVVSHHAPSALSIRRSSSATHCRQPSLPTSTNWWRRPTTGCTVTSTTPSTTASAGHGCWPIRAAIPTRRRVPSGIRLRGLSLSAATG